MADLDTGSLKRVAISKPLSPAPELLLIFACAEIAILAAAFLMVVLALRSKTSRRSSLVQVATAIPSYAAGFALSVVAVWYIFKK
jgi:hypothetical protein